MPWTSHQLQDSTKGDETETHLQIEPIMSRVSNFKTVREFFFVAE